MEKEKRQPEQTPEQTPEQKLNPPEQKEEILKVSPESVQAIENAQQEEVERLREQIKKLFADKEANPIEKSSNLSEKGFEEKSMRKKDIGIVKRIGIRLGESLSWIADSIRSRVDDFDIKYSGGENIKELKGKPYLLAANHIKPKNILMQAMGLSPDSFVLEKIGGIEGEKKPKIITNVTGKISKVPILGLLDKIWSPLRESVMEGMGFIPVKTKRAGKRGGFNRNFIKNVRKAKESGEPIIIFPQGHWSKKFNPNLPFETGTATIAKNYDLPIIPAFIEGANSWRAGQKVSVNIGPSIKPEGKTKEEITVEIKNAIILLSEKTDKSSPNKSVK